MQIANNRESGWVSIITRAMGCADSQKECGYSGWAGGVERPNCLHQRCGKVGRETAINFSEKKTHSGPQKKEGYWGGTTVFYGWKQGRKRRGEPGKG